jgi:hypothetical protein
MHTGQRWALAGIYAPASWILKYCQRKLGKGCHLLIEEFSGDHFFKVAIIHENPKFNFNISWLTLA